MSDDLIERFTMFADSELGLSPNTIAAYKNDLRLFAGYCHDLGIETEAASIDIAAAYLQSLSRAGYAIASICRYMLSIQTFFSFLMERGLVKSNPVKALDLPKHDETIPDVLSKESMALLLATTGGRYACRDSAILELFYASGLRVSELVGLQMDDWHPSLALVKVNGKGSKERVAPVHPTAALALNRYIEELRPGLTFVLCERNCGSNAVFLSRSGVPLTRMAVWHIVNNASIRAGLRHIHPHTLRHTFASHMLSGGANLRVIQEILGHENVETTQRYTHVDLEHLKRIHKLHPRQ